MVLAAMKENAMQDKLLQIELDIEASISEKKQPRLLFPCWITWLIT